MNREAMDHKNIFTDPFYNSSEQIISDAAYATTLWEQKE